MWAIRGESGLGDNDGWYITGKKQPQQPLQQARAV